MPLPCLSRYHSRLASANSRSHRLPLSRLITPALVTRVVITSRRIPQRGEPASDRSRDAFASLLSFTMRWLFVHRVEPVVAPHLQRYSTLPPFYSLSLFLSSFSFYATDFILFLLHTSSAATLFHLRYSSAPRPLELKTDAITSPD